jgi:hypothetical protein
MQETAEKYSEVQEMEAILERNDMEAVMAKAAANSYIHIYGNPEEYNNKL